LYRQSNALYMEGVFLLYQAQLFGTASLAELWEYSPKTVKISNFGHKFTPPQGRLVYNIL